MKKVKLVRLVKPAKLVTVLLVAALAGCTGVRPPQPPVPPIPIPTPIPAPSPNTGVVNAGMLLSRDGVTIKQTNGFAFDFRGAKDCCNSEDGEPNPKWPMGSSGRNAWLKAQGNINFVSTRPGPWRAVPGGEEEFASIGGPYVEVIPGNKADLAQWNPAFWKYVDDLQLDNVTRDQWTEVGVIDGWGLKGGCHAGDIPSYHPWNPANNIQGTGHCSLVFDAVQEAWVRKVVEVFGRHGNVTWEVSNESWLVGGDVVSWEEKVIATIRDEEQRRGYPKHLIATNAERPVPSADWDVFHTNGGGKPLGSRITGVNEYNPEPPMSGSTVAATYCSARAAGVYYWAWRHGMSLVEWQRALSLIGLGCQGSIVCPHPDFEDPRFVIVPGATPQHLDELGHAEGAVRAAHPEWFDGACLAGGGTPPGDNPVHAAERWNFFDQVVDQIAAEMRRGGTCAWQQRRVEIHSLRSDGLWTELHPTATSNGCKSGTPYKQTWKAPAP